MVVAAGGGNASLTLNNPEDLTLWVKVRASCRMSDTPIDRASI
jgi:hypothetical protein